MSFTTMSRGADAPTDHKNEGPKEQGALAQALSGKAFIAEVNRSTMGSLADGGSRALQNTIGGTKDMASANIALEEAGKMPKGQDVANLATATQADKCCNFSEKMSSDKVETAFNQRFDNPGAVQEKKEA